MRDDPAYLSDVVDCCRLALQFLSDLDDDAFRTDPKTQSAVVCQLSFLGEAAKGLSSEFREAHPGIELRQAAAMRDVLVHHYYDIDLRAVWRTARSDLPRMLNLAEDLRARLTSDE